MSKPVLFRSAAAAMAVAASVLCAPQAAAGQQAPQQKPVVQAAPQPEAKLEENQTRLGIIVGCVGLFGAFGTMLLNRRAKRLDDELAAALAQPPSPDLPKRVNTTVIGSDLSGKGPISGNSATLG